MRKQWMAAAAVVMILVGAAHAETAVPADAAAQQRAEVQADLEIWHQAGMTFLPGPSQFPEVKHTPEYRKYQQLRNGPVFQEAVARYLGTPQTALITQTAAGQSPAPTQR